MEKVTGGGAKLYTRSVIIRTARQILLMNKSRKRQLKQVTHMPESLKDETDMKNLDVDKRNIFTHSVPKSRTKNAEKNMQSDLCENR